MAESVQEFYLPGAGMPSASVMGGFSAKGFAAVDSASGGAVAAPPGHAAAAAVSRSEKFSTILWVMAFFAVGMIFLHAA